MKLEESTGCEALSLLMRRTLAQNLTAALMVAGSDQADNGDSVKKMTLTSLNDKTGIAKSTLSKLVHGETPSGKANPDLETICRLAAALNLPPAFLLMSSDDWQLLLSAINGLSLALSGPYLDSSTFTATGNNKVSIGIQLAKHLKLYPDNEINTKDTANASARQSEMEQDINFANKMKRLAILTTTAITQGSAKRPDDIAMLTAIGAIFGANFKHI